MQNYIDLLKDILHNGIDKDDRTGVGSRSVFGKTLTYNLGDGFPMVTTRKVFFRIAFEETMMFLNGITDTTVLEDKNIKIWKDNTSREFLDSRGLHHLPEGSLGKGYSHQWRNFGGSLDQNDGVDQIRELLESLKNDPNGRRHLVSAWNPIQTDEMALPPCHLLQQYQVLDGKLNSLFFMRSSDAYLGLPTNIMSYAYLNMLFAKYLNLEPGNLVYMAGDVHLYMNQLDVAKMQIEREPRDLPQLKINKEINTFEDVMSVEFSDIEITGYDPHPKLPKVKMAV